jgi:N-acyl homoserine lactone hydrolase
MKLRRLAALGGITLAALGAGIAVSSFLPQHLISPEEYEKYYRQEENKRSSSEEAVIPSAPDASFPTIDVTFLRCGSVTIPESLAVRGGSVFAPRVIAYSAVLVRHPRATFLYDTGLCADVNQFLMDQTLFFRKTLGSFTLEQPVGRHLERLGMTPGDLDFILLSHLHWDHVSGIPDLPNVPLRINRVEYDAAKQGLFAKQNGLVPRLMGKNPMQLFDCAGPAYEGFRSSLDLFGDGSIIVVPLPGHTAGQVGMFINRANGSRLFLLGDAVWVSENYLRPATMHPFFWSRVTSDDATARQTLIELYHFSRQHPEVPLIGMHDAAMQEAFTKVEQPLRMQAHS